MSYSVNVRTQITGNGLSTLDKTVAVTGDGLDQRSVSIPAGNGHQVLIAFPIAALKTVTIVADGALTLKTNSTGSPADTIPLAANKPLSWNADSGLTNPFSVDVTTLYFDNAGTVAVNVDIVVLKDATP